MTHSTLLQPLMYYCSFFRELWKQGLVWSLSSSSERWHVIGMSLCRARSIRMGQTISNSLKTSKHIIFGRRLGKQRGWDQAKKNMKENSNKNCGYQGSDKPSMGCYDHSHESEWRTEARTSGQATENNHLVNITNHLSNSLPYGLLPEKLSLALITDHSDQRN